MGIVRIAFPRNRASGLDVKPLIKPILQCEVVCTLGDFEVAGHVELLKIIDLQIEVASGVADDFIADFSVEYNPCLGSVLDVNAEVDSGVRKRSARDSRGFDLGAGFFEPHKIYVIHIGLAIHGQGEVSSFLRSEGSVNF